MHHMIMLILDDIDHCPDVFDAWEKAGVSGITIIESTGLGRVRKRAGMRDDLPLMPNLISLLQSREERHRTLITVVDAEEKVDAVVEATYQAIGDLEVAHKGVLFAWPISRAIGLYDREKESYED